MMARPSVSDFSQAVRCVVNHLGPGRCTCAVVWELVTDLRSYDYGSGSVV